jgi:hypothetical protein
MQGVPLQRYRVKLEALVFKTILSSFIEEPHKDQ